MYKTERGSIAPVKAGKFRIHGVVTKDEIGDFLNYVEYEGDQAVWETTWNQVDQVLKNGGAVTTTGDLLATHYSDLPSPQDVSDLLLTNGTVRVLTNKGSLFPYYLGPDSDQPQTEAVVFIRDGVNKRLGINVWGHGGGYHIYYIRDDRTIFSIGDIQNTLTTFMDRTFRLNGIQRDFPLSPRTLVRQVIRNNAEQHGLGEVEVTFPIGKPARVI